MIRQIIRAVAKLVGEIHAPWTRKKINAYDYRSLMRILSAGDIILTKTHGEITNLLIPGFWKHAAIASTEAGYVIEAVGAGVLKTDLFDFLKTKDFLIVLRPRIATGVRYEAAARAQGFVGCKYDYEFEPGDKEFYCSELVAMSYRKAGCRLIAKSGRILPKDFELLPKIYESLSLSRNSDTLKTS